MIHIVSNENLILSYTPRGILEQSKSLWMRLSAWKKQAQKKYAHAKHENKPN